MDMAAVVVPGASLQSTFSFFVATYSTHRYVAIDSNTPFLGTVNTLLSFSFLLRLDVIDDKSL